MPSAISRFDPETFRYVMTLSTTHSMSHVSHDILEVYIPKLPGPGPGEGVTVICP